MACCARCAPVQERKRFMRALQPLLSHQGPKLIVTDSQVGLVFLYAGIC